MIRLVTILILPEPDLPLRAPGGCLEVRVLDSERCSGSGVCVVSILILPEPDLPLRAPGGFLEVRFLDLRRCSESDLFSIDFDAPGARSSSASSRCVSGGGIS